jgi:hypothetical protein
VLTPTVPPVAVHRMRALAQSATLHTAQQLHRSKTSKRPFNPYLVHSRVQAAPYLILRAAQQVHTPGNQIERMIRSNTSRKDQRRTAHMDQLPTELHTPLVRALDLDRE